ncbi:MAG: hypothetical protein AB7S48_01955 [Bacteroidales bacterium]
MNFLRRAIALVYLFILMPNVHSQEVEPSLFADTSALQVELTYSFDEIRHDNSGKPCYHQAQFRYRNIWGGRPTFDVEIKTRGIFRRNPNNCSQPPLWIKFSPKDVRNTPFEGISKVKLVLQCFDRSQSEQLLLKEYLIYRLYEIVSPQYSYRVRLVRIALLDKFSDKSISMYGFLLEPSVLMAVRLGGIVDEQKNIHPNACSHEFATRMAIFQYMIGHTDWSIKALHNITLIEPEIAAPPVPVPFDFDFSGFVNAPYALPAEQLPIKSVTQRYFNGYCRTENEFLDAISHFNEKKNEIIGCIESFTYIDNKTKYNAIGYINDFFETVNNESKLQREIINGCRTD